MPIDIRLIRTFVAVFDEGSVVGASRARGYSPAAVSRQIGALQRRLGVLLFEPEGRSIRPTDAAFELVAHARVYLEAADDFDRYSSSAWHPVG